MKQQLPVAVIVAAIVLVLAVVGMFAWRTVKSGGDSERVKVDLNKVKEEFQKNGARMGEQ